MSIPLISDIVPSGGGSFAMVQDTYISGGYHCVADLTARDAITTARRKEGMLCYVSAGALTFQLGPGLTNSDWLAVTPAPPQTTGPVDLLITTTGNDSDPSRPDIITSGDWSAYPFLTIQAAIDSLPFGISYPVVIRMAAGTWTEKFSFRPSSGGVDSLVPQQVAPGIRIIGHLGTFTPATGPSSFTCSATAGLGIERTGGAAWTIGQLQGAFLRITGGPGFPSNPDTVVMGPITTNNARDLFANLTVINPQSYADTILPYSYAAGTTFDIVIPDTIIHDDPDGTQYSTTCTIDGAQTPIAIQCINFEPTGTTYVSIGMYYSNYILVQCNKFTFTGVNVGCEAAFYNRSVINDGNIYWGDTSHGMGMDSIQNQNVVVKNTVSQHCDGFESRNDFSYQMNNNYMINMGNFFTYASFVFFDTTYVTIEGQYYGSSGGMFWTENCFYTSLASIQIDSTGIPLNITGSGRTYIQLNFGATWTGSPADYYLNGIPLNNVDMTSGDWYTSEGGYLRKDDV